MLFIGYALLHFPIAVLVPARTAAALQYRSAVHDRKGQARVSQCDRSIARSHAGLVCRPGPDECSQVAHQKYAAVLDFLTCLDRICLYVSAVSLLGPQLGRRLRSARTLPRLALAPQETAHRTAKIIDRLRPDSRSAR